MASLLNRYPSVLILATSIAIFWLPFPSTPVVAADFYIAPNGNDQHDGSQSQPFATLPRAQKAVRQARHTATQQTITVTLASGRYELAQPIQFRSEDSGFSADQPVIYRAAPGAKVVLSGGRRIADWSPAPNRPGVWRTRIAPTVDERDERWRFEQLWVNGRRAQRARTPNREKFFQLAKNVVEEPIADQANRFRHSFFTHADDLKSLSGLEQQALSDVLVTVFHKWDTTREWLLPISSPIAQDSAFMTEGSRMKSWNSMTRDSLYYFENYLAALDAPGEWFLDRDRWLYYRPQDGELMSNAEVIAPGIDRFLVLQGDVNDPSRRVRHLRFFDIAFQHADFRIPKEGQPPHQAAMCVEDAVIAIDGAEDIQFADCAVEHIGTTAFWFHQACRHCRVERTRMFDLGVSGVRIGETSLVPDPIRTGQITVDNCIIQQGGRIMPSAVGVWIGHSSDNTISHCDIADFFYTAVSVGWRWGYAESGAQRNRIEFNHLHHLGFRILSDMGGVYTLGPSAGTRVCNNVIHDVYATRYGGWGLYPDEGSTGILYENNLVYDVHDGCFHQHYGKDNIVRNNILAFSEEGQVAVTRAEPHTSFTFERNIVYWDSDHLLGHGGWAAGAHVVLRNNLYWRVNGKPFDLAGKTWQEWQKAGNDLGSIIADPQFVNAAQRDFRFREESPIAKIGFQTFDYSKAGVYGDTAWRELANALTYPALYEPPAPAPLTFTDGFENTADSTLLNLATFRTEDRPELVFSTDQFAASGRHCLHVQDAPDLHAAYNPHFFFDPQLTTGTATLAFTIRLEKGAHANGEWRSKGHPYRVGPSVTFRDGSIYANSQRLLNYPIDQWIRVQMTVDLGKLNSRWRLSVVLEDGTSHQWDDLPCDRDWKAARWIGFSSPSRNAAAFYLDDFSVRN